jgi:methylated-DNA-[protein]-cysteine S-methyltransferase
MYARDQALIATPIGMIRVVGDDEAVFSVHIEPGTAIAVAGHQKAVRQAAIELAEYFAGERQRFDVQLAPAPTPRAAALRAGIMDISIGNTMS